MAECAPFFRPTFSRPHGSATSERATNRRTRTWSSASGVGIDEMVGTARLPGVAEGKAERVLRYRRAASWAPASREGHAWSRLSRVLRDRCCHARTTLTLSTIPVAISRSLARVHECRALSLPRDSRRARCQRESDRKNLSQTMPVLVSAFTCIAGISALYRLSDTCSPSHDSTCDQKMLTNIPAELI